MGNADNTDKKKRPLASAVASPAPKRLSLNPPSDEKKIEQNMLQFQNQKLSEQLEVQKIKVSELEEKLNSFCKKQEGYDDTLLLMNRVWNELTEDLVMLAVRANASMDEINELNHDNLINNNDTDKIDEKTFLNRLLQFELREYENEEEKKKEIESKFDLRREKTVQILKVIILAIDKQKINNEELHNALEKNLPTSEIQENLKLNYENLSSELKSNQKYLDDMQIKHKEIVSEISRLKDEEAKYKCNINRLNEQLEDNLATLDSTRRKLISFKQKESSFTSSPSNSNLNSNLNLNNTPTSKTETEENINLEKSLSKENQLQIDLEDAKRLSEKRLAELEAAHESHMNLTKQIHQLQVDNHTEQSIHQSRPYQMLNEQNLFLRAEIDGYRLVLEQLQRERDMAILREKELMFKAEAGDSAWRAGQLSETRVQELEVKLQQCTAERDKIQRRLDEAQQAAGRKETVTELKVMVTTLHKEMNMLQSQLNKYKEASQQVHSLRAETISLNSILKRMKQENESMAFKCSNHLSEIKALKEIIKEHEEYEEELKLFLNVFSSETIESREMIEIKKEEAKILSENEKLKRNLSENVLQLQILAANENEKNVQKKLTAVENEILELRNELDSSERLVIELKETLQSKNDEIESYISEIDTIGQAYEEMQSQNRRLLQQITERDEYNTQLISESVRAKQQQASLAAEKDALISKIQHSIATSEIHKQRIARLEEQAKSYLDQLGNAAEESRQMALSLEMTKRRQGELERELTTVKSSSDDSVKAFENQVKNLKEAEIELEKERFKRKRVEEEVESLKNKVMRLGGNDDQDARTQQLQEEIKEYKSLLKCSVCHDRPKEVIITKCYHLFCSPCIQRNLEIRHRKCPGCGIPFGQSDVHNVYI